MMHLAMHDALNAIVPVYESLRLRRRSSPCASDRRDAQAAHDVLVAQYPDQQRSSEISSARWLAHVPDGALRDRGIALGQAAAAAIARAARWRRLGFPRHLPVPAKVRAGIKRRRRGTASSRNQDFGSRNRSSSSTRSSSGRRLRRRCGARRTRARSAKSRSTALPTARDARTSRPPMPSGGWSSPRGRSIASRGSWRPIATCISGKAARLFAHVGVALYDTYVATWDSKYAYDHWRPYTAIRAADTDENPRTASDASWEPLRPDAAVSRVRVGARGCLRRLVSACSSRRSDDRVLVHDGDDDRPTRHADANVRQLRCRGRRVCGFTRAARLAFPHTATDAGLALGAQVARYTLSHSLRTLRE